MTKQSSNGKWKCPVMERKRSLSTLFWARYDQWSCAVVLPEMVENGQGSFKPRTLGKLFQIRNCELILNKSKHPLENTAKISTLFALYLWLIALK